jgi:hypothetical protein
LRWLWIEWKHKERICVSSGNPCTAKGINLFYAATSILAWRWEHNPIMGGTLARWLRSNAHCAPYLFVLNDKELEHHESHRGACLDWKEMDEVFKWTTPPNTWIFGLKFSTFILRNVLRMTLIRLKRIYNFWCSMLVFTPFA